MYLKSMSQKSICTEKAMSQKSICTEKAMSQKSSYLKSHFPQNSISFIYKNDRKQA